MDDKVRVFEIAEEAGSTSAEVIKKAADLAIVLKSPQSSVSFEEAEEIAGYIMTGTSKLLKPKKEAVTKKKTEAKKEETVQEAKPQEIEKEEKKVSKAKELPKRKELKIVQKKATESEIVSDVKKEVKVAAQEVVENEEKPESVLNVKEKIVEEVPEIEEDEVVSSKDNDKVVLKKRGLTIVKKKKPVISHTPATPQSKKQKMASMSELFGASADLQEEYSTKPKKVKPKTAAKAHEHGKKLMVEPERDEFKEPDESLMGEEVVTMLPHRNTRSASCRLSPFSLFPSS